MSEQVAAETAAPTGPQQQPKCAIEWCIALADGDSNKCTVHRRFPEFKPESFKPGVKGRPTDV